MQLVADRFIPLGSTARDLATGAEVAFRTISSASAQEERRWAVACDEAARWHHPATPRLIDFGSASATIRFEARELPGRSNASRRVRDLPAIACIPRAVVGAVGDALDHSNGMRPRWLVVSGPGGSGRHTIVEDVARLARQRGFVPVAASLLAACFGALRGRSLLVIETDRARCGWVGWLLATLHAARPQGLLLISEETPPSNVSLPIAPVPIDALVRSLGPAAGSPTPSTIHRLAVRSRGWPGRFARLVWQLPPASTEGFVERSRGVWGSRTETSRGLRAAEQPAIYEAQAAPAARRIARGGFVQRRSDIDRWCGRLESAGLFIAKGRHALGERLLRQ
jgi:hypothetical protein